MKKKKLLTKKKQPKGLVATSEEALKIFQQIAEEVKLKCPRCKHVFNDYNGCNALKCSCGAAFCALCLLDCGQDARKHIQQRHPKGMSSKNLFEKSTEKRTREIVDAHLRRIQNGRKELAQLIKNHVDRSEILQSPISASTASSRIKTFLSTAKKNLEVAIRGDRLSLLSDQESGGSQPLCHEMVSPRCAIPSDYRLTLTHVGNGKYKISLEREQLGRWTQVSLEAEGNTSDPIVDSLTNLSASLRCAVVAIDGERYLYQTRFRNKDSEERTADDEITISFQRVASNGDTLDEFGIDKEKLQIVGLNPNRRIILLQNHVETSDETDLITTPLKHLIGGGNPIPLLDQITRPAPITLLELNKQQRQVADPLCMLTAMEVAGPPGSGKTKTITELTRSILACTDYSIIVLSERNGAIDAIAEKFAQSSISMKDQDALKVTDMELWTTVTTFGSGGVGSFTKLFTIDEKLGYHPQLVKLRAIRQDNWDQIASLAKTQRELLSSSVLDLGMSQTAERAVLQSGLILNDQKKDLSRPTEAINFVETTHRNISEIISNGISSLTEQVIDDLLDRANLLVGQLLPNHTDRERRFSPDGWQTQTMTTMNSLQTMFANILKHKLFDREKADSMSQRAKDLDLELEEREESLRDEFLQNSRLQMCTIGSSHKLPTHESFHDRKDKGMSGMMDRLQIDGSDTESQHGKPGFVFIFDEAGCIPSYELLGLSRLGCAIEAISVVGDVHQLPPYDPGADNFRKGKGKREKVQSLLDASFLSTKKSNKIMLTTQYRVPRDLAKLLNYRIYRGKYQTAAKAKVPSKGFHFVHVPHSESQKYINENEVEVALELIERSERKGYTSISVLTPYKKQQREIQFRLRRMNKDNVSVLTIDQCQGQEADIVILSLVRKPTKFLNKNRLNVALSRVRKELYLLVDKDQFKQASNNRGWDCNLIARDLLSMRGAL